MTDHLMVHKEPKFKIGDQVVNRKIGKPIVGRVNYVINPCRGLISVIYYYQTQIPPFIMMKIPPIIGLHEWVEKYPGKVECDCCQTEVEKFFTEPAYAVVADLTDRELKELAEQYRTPDPSVEFANFLIFLPECDLKLFDPGEF